MRMKKYVKFCLDTALIVALVTLAAAIINVIIPRFLKWWDEYQALKRESQK